MATDDFFRTRRTGRLTCATRWRCFFRGMAYHEPRLPCDATQVGRFRRVLGEPGVEQLLKTTIETTVALGAAKKAEFERVIVDTTVQEKGVAFPTGRRSREWASKLSRLRARTQGAAPARRRLRPREAVQAPPPGPQAPAGRAILGRLRRDVPRKMRDLPQAGQDALKVWLQRAERIQRERPKDQHKLYALHAQEVECIGKGKARQPYEFGVRTSLTVTHRSGLVVGAWTFPGNPYDGHTLPAQIDQTTTLIEVLGVKPTTAVADLGYRDVDHWCLSRSGTESGYRTMTHRQRRWLKRRQVIEPVIGHLKSDHGMRRCWLRGSEGDALNAVLCAAGFNICWLIRPVARLGLRALLLTSIERASYASDSPTGGSAALQRCVGVMGVLVRRLTPPAGMIPTSDR